MTKMALSGVYALVLEIPQRTGLSAGKRSFEIPQGTCVYCGSAMGPGGVEARVARHLRRFFSSGDGVSRPHWHVDGLLAVASSVTAVSAYTNARMECTLAKALGSLGMEPVRGFGNTDCREGCSSHLLCTRLGGSEAVHQVTAAMRGIGLEPSVSETFVREKGA